MKQLNSLSIHTRLRFHKSQAAYQSVEVPDSLFQVDSLLLSNEQIDRFIKVKSTNSFD